MNTTMLVSKETKATVEGISPLEGAFKILMEYLVESKLHQSEELSSQIVELSFGQKIKDKIYMKTDENFNFRVLVGSP